MSYAAISLNEESNGGKLAATGDNTGAAAATAGAAGLLALAIAAFAKLRRRVK